MEIRDNGTTNPLIIFTPDDVMEWMRAKADAAGYADRATCAVQIGVEQPFMAGSTFHGECPTLALMVSNIKRSK